MGDEAEVVSRLVQVRHFRTAGICEKFRRTRLEVPPPLLAAVHQPRGIYFGKRYNVQQEREQKKSGDIQDLNGDLC
jgi:hypothetical protein